MMAPSDKAKVYNLRDLLDEVVAEHDAADLATAEGRSLGPLVPWPRLAEELGGTWPVGLVGMHATPGAGKSAFGLQAAVATGCPSIVLTCEMSAKTVLRRLIAAQTNSFLGRLGRGKMSAGDLRTVAARVVESLPNFAIIDAVTAVCPADWLDAVAKRFRENGHEHVFILVDSLQAWARGLEVASNRKKSLTEYEAVSQAVNALRGIAQQRNAAILAIVERNRASMDGGGLSAGAGSRTIEYSAEAVIELEVVDFVLADDASGVNVRFAKNRNGRAGKTVGFSFSGATQRFNEIGPPWPKPVKARRGTAPRARVLEEEPEDDE